MCNLYKEAYRPQFHFSAPRGWHNDPNGLVYYHGEYHLFYQHYPHDIHWGPMHWGHAVSRDMIHWENLPIALEPDELGTIFSGTAVVDENDTTGFFGGGSGIVTIFTYHSDERECQGIAYSLDDGRTWIKYAGNPVLCGEDSKAYRDFRDPKVFWHAPSGKWIMFVGGGMYRIYSSPDLKNWTFESSPGVWEEFPDVFELPVDGQMDQSKWVLCTAGYGYYTGSFDGHQFRMEQPYQLADYGKSWQAAYCFNNMPDDRCVWLAWMVDSSRSDTYPWRSNMSIPRELGLKSTPFGLALTQQPVKELESLRGQGWHLENVPLHPGENPLAHLSGNTFDLEAEFSIESDAEFGVEFFKGAENVTVAKYMPASCAAVADVLCSTDKKYAKNETSFRFFMYDGLKVLAKSSEAYLPAPGRTMKIRVIADVTAVEIFFGDGEVVFSHSVYPPEDARGLGIFTSGEGITLKSCHVYEMKSIW